MFNNVLILKINLHSVEATSQLFLLSNSKRRVFKVGTLIASHVMLQIASILKSQIISLSLHQI